MNNSKIDILNAGPSEVRSSPTLMAEYKRQFQEQFGYEPECPTCGSTKDWNLFQSLANGQDSKKILKMTQKTFELAEDYNIYSFDVFDKKLERIVRKRTYGYLMSEEFALEYLTHGTEEEIQERKNQFRILPQKFTDLKDEEPTSDDVSNLSKLTKEKLQALATEKEFPKEEWQSLKKDELITYLGSKLIEEDEEHTSDDAQE